MAIPTFNQQMGIIPNIQDIKNTNLFNEIEGIMISKFYLCPPNRIRRWKLFKQIQ